MKRMKVLSMYLPQFHRLPENDEWWGEGFTDWIAVKSAEKFFETQNQPREPYLDNYYDLMKKETMVWQADLAQRYGVDGFCFYHYYFKDGRKILEGPAENLLKWKEINMPFCFCWANETWARTWSNISFSNAWSEKFEKNRKEDKTILLEQDYGNKKDWKKHFDYLLPFFEDERYIRIMNKPVFLFYKPDDISILSEMIAYWNYLIELEGEEGIYAIAVNSSHGIPGVDAILLHAPNAYRKSYINGMNVKEKWINGVGTFAYQDVWDNSFRAHKIENTRTYFGAFVDYDDTPRRGKMGSCVTGVTPENFEKNLYKLAAKNMACENEILFINAWNEWGEGNYLEPDKKNAYKYLSAVKNVSDKCNSGDFNATAEWEKLETELSIGRERVADKLQPLIDEVAKYRDFYKLMDRWLFLKENGKCLYPYFEEHGYRRIIIYGFASLGKHLYEEMKETRIEVVCALDRRSGIDYKNITVQNPEMNIPDCDVIIITAISDWENISRELKRKTNCPVVSLQEVIFYPY